MAPRIRLTKNNSADSAASSKSQSAARKPGSNRMAVHKFADAKRMRSIQQLGEEAELLKRMLKRNEEEIEKLQSRNDSRVGDGEEAIGSAEEAVNAMSSDGAARWVTAIDHSSLQQRLDGLGEENEKLREENEAVQKEKWDLMHVSSVPSDDAIANKFETLFYAVESWVTGLFSNDDYEVTFKTSRYWKSQLWNERWMPACMESTYKPYIMNSLSSLIGVTIAEHHLQYGPFGAVAQKSSRGFASASAEICQIRDASEFKRWVLFTDGLRRKRDDGYRKKLRVEQTDLLVKRFMSVLGSNTEMKKPKQHTVALHRIADLAIDLMEDLHLNLASYRFAPFKTTWGNYDSCRYFNGDIHQDVAPIFDRTNELDIVGLVFPGLNKISNEKGNKIDVVICKAKIQTADPYGEETATKDQEQGAEDSRK